MAIACFEDWGSREVPGGSGFEDEVLITVAAGALELELEPAVVDELV